MKFVIILTFFALSISAQNTLLNSADSLKSLLQKYETSLKINQNNCNQSYNESCDTMLSIIQNKISELNQQISEIDNKSKFVTLSNMDYNYNVNVAGTHFKRAGILMYTSIAISILGAVLIANDAPPISGTLSMSAAAISFSLVPYQLIKGGKLLEKTTGLDNNKKK